MPLSIDFPLLCLHNTFYYFLPTFCLDPAYVQKDHNQQSDWFSLCDFLHLSAFLRQIEFLPNSLMVLPYMKLTLYFFWQMKPIAKSEFLFFSPSEMSK